MAHPLLSDDFVRQLIEEAAAPWSRRLEAEDGAWLRDQLAVLLSTEPELAAMLKGAHPRNIDASGERGPLGIDDARAPQAAEGD